MWYIYLPLNYLKDSSTRPDKCILYWRQAVNTYILTPEEWNFKSKNEGGTQHFL